MDPWLGLVALALRMADQPPPNCAGLSTQGTAGVCRDPGASTACPKDMRLVEGLHFENVAHICLDPPPPPAPGQAGQAKDAKKNPKKKVKKESSPTLHCYRYAEDFSILEGPAARIAVCMDQFEAPNRRGADPLVMESFDSASRWCKKRGKRMCREQEWELACEGPEFLPLHYGWHVNVNLCNSNKQWRPVDFAQFNGPRGDALKESAKLWQGTPSGRYPTCVSHFGIYDLNGNVEEWVSSRAGRRWPGALMGGFWAKPWTGCRGTNDAHQPTFAFYETGFRCCKDPLPAPPARAAP